MIHNGLSRLTEVQRGAKVAFGLDSGEGGLERLSESIQIVKDFWAHPEDHYLRGSRLACGVQNVAPGGAGNYSAAGIAMQNDGWISVLERLIITTEVNGTVLVVRGLPLPNTGTQRFFRDMRITGSTPITRIGWVNNVAAIPGGTNGIILRMTANVPLYLDMDCVLVSGGPVATETAIVAYFFTANSALNVNFFWRERQLLPGELYR